MTITITWDPRYRIWKAAAEDSARPEFTCVLIDPSGVLVAADGFVVGLVKANVGNLDKPVLIAAAAFENSYGKLILNMKKETGSMDMGDRQTRIWPFSHGTFPKWRLIVPKLSDLRFGLPVGGYDPALAARASAVVGGHGVTGGGTGMAQAFVVVDPEGKALAIVMPKFYPEGDIMLALENAYKNLGLTVPEPVAG